MNVIVPEYPGYGPYEGSPSEEQIFKDAISVYEFVISDLGFQPEDIVIIGRSIGSGPACHVASLKKVAGLLLISPFSSISEVVEDKFGKVISMIVRQRFNNKIKLMGSTCKVHLVHGELDTVVNHSHSLRLKGKLSFMKEVLGNRARLYLQKDMDHSIKDMLNQVLAPLLDLFSAS